MSRTLLVLITFPALLLAGCDGGRSHVIVGSKEPKYSEDSEWSEELERVGSARTKDWRLKYGQYSQSLVARAAEAGLDSVSLSNVLQVVLADAPRKRRAYLPFAAYSVKVEHEPVWVVHLAWECDGGDQQLLHHCCYSINAQNLREVGFVTCM